MRFLKLLDPWETKEGSSLTVGEQQGRAAQLFPTLVERSNLHYWRPGDDICGHGRRFLMGLAASFNLQDLRLADIVNLEVPRNPGVRVDVFNVAADCLDVSDLSRYYPDLPSLSYVDTPVVGFWKNGIYQLVRFGFDARKFILEALNSSVRAEESVSGLSPPDRKLMED